MKSITNGFATKADLKKLEKKVDVGFEQVDKRFEQVDKRFEQVDKRFEKMNSRFEWFRDEMKLDLEQSNKELFTEFDYRWTTKIDPILVEIEKHREKEIIWAEQSRRTEKLLRLIANKVGVEIS